MSMRLLGCLLAVTFSPTLVWPAPPIQGISTTAHDSLLGCRWRRCASNIPQLPRAEGIAWLRLKFDKGPSYFAEVTTETKQVMKVMGQEVMQTQTQTLCLRLTPMAVDEGGHGLVRMQIIGVTVKIDIGDVTIDYDSTRDRKLLNPLTDYFQKLLDADFKLAIDPKDGETLIIDGHDELMRKFNTFCPSMDPLWKTVFSREAIAQVAAPCFQFVPENAVRRSDRWERSHRIDLGAIGGYRSVNRYTYDGRFGSHDRILVQNTVKYEPSKDKTTLPFTIKSAELKSTAAKGEILFDAARGRLVGSDVSMTLAGKLIVEIGGMETEVDLRQTQRTRIRVTDVNPHLQQSEPRRARRGYSRLSSN